MEVNVTTEPKQDSEHALQASGLLLSGYLLEKHDRGKVTQQFDLREVEEIVVGKERAYGCIIFALVFIYFSIFLAWAYFSDPEVGSTVAIMTGGLGMVGLWLAKDAYHYFLSFSYHKDKIWYPIHDPQEKIERFLARIKESIQQQNSKLMIRNLLEDDEDDEDDVEQ